MADVVEMNKNRIVLKGIEVAALLNIILFKPGDLNPICRAFGRVCKASKVKGTLQMRLYEVQVKLGEIGKNMETVRLGLIAEYADKNEDGAPLFVDGAAKFSLESNIAFNKEFQDLMSAENVLPFDKIEIGSASLESMNNRPVVDKETGKIYLSPIDDPVTIDDMIMLGLIFTFKEK